MNSDVITNLEYIDNNRSMKATGAGIIMSFLGFVGGMTIGYLDGQFTLGIIAGSIFGILVYLWNLEE